MNKAFLYNVPSSVFQGAINSTSVNSLIESGAQIYILVNDQFMRTRSGNIAAGKCYLTLTDNAASRLNIMIDDEPTGVSLMSTSPADVPIYNMQGVRVVKPGKGLYIVNGKKMVVK